MTTRFEIVIKHEGGSVRAVSSVAAGGSTTSQSAQQIEREEQRKQRAFAKTTSDFLAGIDKRVKASEKEAAARNKFASFGGGAGGLGGLDKSLSSRIAATKRLDAEINKTFSTLEARGDKQAQIADKAADAEIKSFLRIRREYKTNSDAIIREAERRAREEQKAAAKGALGGRLQAAGAGLAQGTNTVLSGARGAARTLGGGIAGAASTLGTAGLSGLLGGAPFRASGELLSSGFQAGAQLAQAVGKGLSQALPKVLGVLGGAGELVGSLAGTLAKAIGSAFSVAGQIAGALARAAGEIAGFLGDQIGIALKVGLAAAIGLAVAGIGAALKSEDLKLFFDDFAKASGKTAVDALDGLRKATKGMISDFDLLKEANTAYLNNAVGTTTEFEKLASLAVQVGKAIGERPVEALHQLTEAVGGLRAKGLKPLLGAEVDFETAFQNLADSTGRSVEKISLAEKRTVALGIILDAGRKKFAGAGADIDNASDKFDRFKSTVSNLLDKIGTPMLNALGSVLSAITPLVEAFGKFFDRNSVVIGEALTKAVGGLAEKLENVRKFIVGVKLNELWKIAQIGAENLWIRFRSAATFAWDWVLLKGKATLLDLGIEVAEFVKKWGIVLGALHGLGGGGGGSGGGGIGGSLVSGGLKGAGKLIGGGVIGGAIGGGVVSVAASAMAEELRSSRTGTGQDLSRLESKFKKSGGVPDAGDRQTLEENTTALEKLTDTILGREGAEKNAAANNRPPPTPGLDLFDRQREPPAGAGFGLIQGIPAGKPGGPPLPKQTQTVGTTFDTSLAQSILKSMTAEAGKLGSEWKTFVATLTATLNDPKAIAKVQVALNKLAEDEKFDEFKKKQNEALSLRIEQFEREKKYAEDEISRLGTLEQIQSETTQKITDASNKELEAREHIAEQFKAASEGIVSNFKSVLDGIAQRIAQASDSLKSAAGFGGPFGGADLDAAIPLKVKSAANKAKRRATRALKHDINQRVAGLGQDDIIEQQDSIFGDIGKKQVLGNEGGAAVIAQQMAQSLNQLSDARAKRDEEESKAFEEMTNQIDALRENEETSLQTVSKALDTIQTLNTKIEAVKKALADNESQMNTIRSAVSK